MIQEIYTRNPSDPNFTLNVLSHSDPIECIISKIKMLLGTRQGQIMGDLNFGIGIEDYIFETKINKFQLEEKIKQQMGQYVSETADYNIQPSISFGKADGCDYCVIDFLINGQKTFGILVR